MTKPEFISRMKDVIEAIEVAQCYTQATINRNILGFTPVSDDVRVMNSIYYLQGAIKKLEKVHEEIVNERK